MKTFKKVMATAGLVSMLAMNVAMAAQIGTGTITDGTSTGIIWDDAFPGTATWVLTPVVVTASVTPVLNMTVSTGGLALGTLVPGTPSSQSLDMELGTNATNGVTVTASSSNGGLTSATASGVINDDTNWANADGVAESYTFASTANADDSNVTDFSANGVAATEVNTVGQAVTVYNSNRPQTTSVGVDDVTFTVSATSAEETAAADDYTDTITFTVVGSF